MLYDKATWRMACRRRSFQMEALKSAAYWRENPDRRYWLPFDASHCTVRTQARMTELKWRGGIRYRGFARIREMEKGS